jgi:hypothetical protein
LPAPAGPTAAEDGDGTVGGPQKKFQRRVQGSAGAAATAQGPESGSCRICRKSKGYCLKRGEAGHHPVLTKAAYDASSKSKKRSPVVPTPPPPAAAPTRCEDCHGSDATHGKQAFPVHTLLKLSICS